MPAGGFSQFGTWDQFVATANISGFAWKNLLGQDRLLPWTPELRFGGTATGLGYLAQGGYYYQIGKLVLASFNVFLAGKGTSTGNAQIYNLPFEANGLFRMPAELTWSGMASNLISVRGFTSVASSVLQLYGLTAAADGTFSLLTDSAFDDDSALTGCVVYMIR